MDKFLKNRWPLFILFVLAFLTRFLFLSYPSEVVFDEVHFGKFVSSYFTHQYYFDIHPPLGKLVIAGFAKIFGFSGNFSAQGGPSSGWDFANIGENLDAHGLFILRFLPALLGAFFVILIYKFVLLLGLSKKAAFLVGFLVLFDNAILVESKFILVDIFLLFFGFLSLYFFILAQKTNKNKFVYYSISAILAGLAFSIKWTGLSFLGIIILLLLFDFIKGVVNRKANWKLEIGKLAIFFLIPFLIYFSIFVIHFKLLPQSGPGDAFMSPDFKNENVWQKFVELNQKMYFYSSTLKTGHQDASKWFEWPKMSKPVWYWTKTIDGKIANIYLLGNPLIWWLVAIIVPISLLFLLLKKGWQGLPPIIYLFLLGYFANLLPFIFISRVAFLYHYLPALTFGILIFAFLTQNIFKNNFFYFSFLFLVFTAFLILSPLSYGFSVSPEINQSYHAFIFFLH